MTIDLNQQLPTSTIDLEDQPIPVSSDVASTRATKAVFGTNVGYDDVYSAIASGREKQIRDQIASEQSAKNAKDIASFISTRQTPLTPEEINEKFNKPVDPGSVFEDNYAKQYVNYLYQIPGHEIVDDNGMWRDAVQTIPGKVQATTDFARDLVTKREVLNRRAEDAKAALEQQSYFGYGVDLAKSLTQIYPEAKLRGNIPGSEFGLGLGTAIENQRLAYWHGANSEVVPAFNETMDRLIKDNPQMAVYFASGMQALNDTELDNLFTIAAPLDVYGLARLGMNVAKIPRAIALGKQVDAAAKSIVKSAPNAEASTVRRAAADAVGDNAVAGQRGFVDQILAGDQDPWNFGFGGQQQTLPGTDRLKDTVKSFQSVFQSDMDKALARPGNYGAEVMNRLKESYQSTMEGVTNAIINVARVERIGQVLASEKVVKAISAEMRENYKNLANSIIQINPPTWDSLTGGHSVDLILGRSDATFFASREEAQAWAELNNISLGRQKLVFEGGNVPIPPEGDKRLRRTLTKEHSLGIEFRETEYTNAQGEKVKARVAVSKNVPKTPEELKIVSRGGTGVVHGAEIGSQGKKYYIAVNKPIRETSDLIRDGLMETEASLKSNKGFLNSLGLPAWVRTPGEVLSQQEMTNRITAIYTPAVMKQVISNAMQEMGVAKKFGVDSRIKRLFGAKSDFDRFLEFGQKKIDPVTGKPGYTWTNPQDMSEAFHQTMGRVPDPVEVEGYFAAQRGMAMDWAFRNLALYRNMQRVGGETHTINLMVNGTKTASNSFVGTQLKQLPKDGYNTLLMDDQGPKGYKSHQFENAARGRASTERIAKGEDVVLDLYDPQLRPLKGFNQIVDIPYRHVVTAAKNLETKPLEFTQIPRTGGTHFVYDANHYIKQAKVSVDKLLRGEKQKQYETHYYEGDTTVMPIDNRALGSDVVERLNAVRIALRDGIDLNAVRDIARALPIPFEDLHGWFYPKKGPGGVEVPARLDVHQPFYVVPKDKMVKDVQNHFNQYGQGGNKFIDGTREGSLARQFQVEFTGERDAQEVFTIADPGTRANPLYDYRPAEMIDPTTVMNRALSRVVDSIWMDDYKISSMEHWMQEAIKLNAFQESDKELRGAPWHYFMNGRLKTGLPTEVANLLEAKRWMIKNFNGVPSTIDAWSHGVQQTLADAVYGGSNAVIRKGALLSKYALAATTNAPSFLRSVAYRMDIGLFSIPQLIVQSQNYVSIFGIAGPVRASQGTVGALLHQYARINANPEILQSLDKIAQKWGWNPGEWLEAREALTHTGFEYVSKETNVLMSSYHMQPNFFKSSWGTMLDVGEMPFKGGERHARYGAWYSSYKEKGLVGKASNQDLNSILNRASIMAGDMTKASKSALQMGPLSFPTQFLGYTMRLSEQFTGKRLSNIEKARLFGFYGLAYGLPVSSSAVLLGLPINESIKKAALDYGYVDGENQISNGVMNGLPAAIMQMVTGNRYNVPERLGPGNYDLYRDMLAGDKPFWSVVSGPTGALATNAAEAMDPFMGWITDHLRGGHTKLKIDDLLGVLKQSAGASNIIRLGHALATGDWASRNENVIKRNVSAADALWMTGTGLQPMEATDARVIKSAQEDQKAKDQETGTAFKKEFLRGMQAVNNQDFDNADEYFNRAYAWLAVGHYPKEREAELYASTLSPDTWPDRVKWSYYLGRDVPSGKNLVGGKDIRQIRQEAFTRIQQQGQK